jgi:dephospho-CoA kinase
MNARRAPSECEPVRDRGGGGIVPLVSGERLDIDPRASASGEPAHRPTIGLVGGIGSGKSAVASILRELGCVVCHSDDLARAAFDDPAIRSTLLAWWGDRVLGPDGSIDRAGIAKIVFADESERRRLESLVHPWIERTRRAAFAAAPPQTRGFVIDAPLLLEVGLDRECDAVVFVDAPHAERARRVERHRRWNVDELDRREAVQWSLDRKRAAADHVIRNAGDLSALRAATLRVFDAILAGPSRNHASSAP